MNYTLATSYNYDATSCTTMSIKWCNNWQYFLFHYLHSTSCTTNWPRWSL